MKQQGMGRTRLGRFAAVGVPAALASLGLGAAIMQGMVGAALASATSFQVTGTQVTGDALELTANYAKAATSDTNDTSTNKKDALVSIKNGVLTNMCLAADTAVPVLGTLGLKIQSTGNTSLGSGYTDLSTDSLNGDAATLGTTDIGYSQSNLTHQKALGSDNNGYAAGAWSLATRQSTGAVNITGLDSNVYALTLDGLSLNDLAIAATTGSVEGTC